MAELLQGKALFPGSDCILGPGGEGGLSARVPSFGGSLRGRAQPFVASLASSPPVPCHLGALSRAVGEGSGLAVGIS